MIQTTVTVYATKEAINPCVYINKYTLDMLICSVLCSIPKFHNAT